jgi:glyoxylase-like metal-dependent hydrolase (beta-lactamase superfamily II)
VDTQVAGRELYLGFTHSDYDHIIGVGAFPEATIIASNALAERKDTDDEIAQVQLFDDKNYCRRSYPIHYPAVDLAIDPETDAVQLGDWTLYTWFAPGHNPDGQFFYDPDSGTLLLGDYLSPLEFPFVYHSFSLYQQTLELLAGILKDLQPALIVPGHGRPYTSIDTGLAFLERDLAYLQAVAAAEGTEEAFPWQDWSSRFPFPKGLLEEHRKNLAVWRREQG